MRWDLPVGEQPVEITCPRAIEAELHRRVCERRDDSRLEVHLQIDDEVELAAGELAPHVGERARPERAVELDDLVDASVAAYERRGAG